MRTITFAETSRPLVNRSYRVIHVCFPPYCKLDCQCERVKRALGVISFKVWKIILARCVLPRNTRHRLNSAKHCGTWIMIWQRNCYVKLREGRGDFLYARNYSCHESHIPYNKNTLGIIMTMTSRGSSHSSALRWNHSFIMLLLFQFLTYTTLSSALSVLSQEGGSLVLAPSVPQNLTVSANSTQLNLFRSVGISNIPMSFSLSGENFLAHSKILSIFEYPDHLRQSNFIATEHLCPPSTQ